VTRYQVSLDWFNGDDTEETEVEADDLDAAARSVWEEWASTGWTGASIREDGRYISLDLEAKTFEDAVWDSAAPERMSQDTDRNG
jgi:hypothetical protein